MKNRLIMITCYFLLMGSGIYGFAQLAKMHNNFKKGLTMHLRSQGL